MYSRHGVHTAKVDLSNVPYGQRDKVIFNLKTRILTWVAEAYSGITSARPQIVTKGDSVGVNLHGREVAKMVVEGDKINLKYHTPESGSLLPCMF